MREKKQVLTNPVGLSERLKAIVELAGQGETLCDVGCDHAHVPIRLLQTGRYVRAIGMDVIEGPLGKAGGNLALYGLSDRVQLRKSDGLDAYLAGEAQTLVIAGMGGTLMEDILLREPEKTKSFSALVLGPQSDPDKVRAAVRKLGFMIEDERLIYEDGKYYPVLRAVSEKEKKDADGTEPAFAPGIPPERCLEAMDMFGPVLLKRRDPVLLEYLTRQTAVQEKILESVSRAAQESRHLREKHEARRREISRGLEIFRAALTVFSDQ